MITLYGIPNCDTIKKAKKWLDEHDMEYAFHDYKKQGADRDILQKATTEFGWENVLNKRGTTWRKLDDSTKEHVTDEKSAIDLMIENPSMIKRPILTRGNTILLGFKADKYDTKLA